uniref:ADP-ribosylation factor-like protein 2-binding protein n=1 Tax=Hemiselmis andersenii TaxID=464988 RepID=A0A6U4NUG4_HEMAN
MAGRYDNMEEDKDEGQVEECIDGQGDDGFLDMVDDFDEFEDEEGDVSIVSMGGQNEDDDKFDTVIGALEDIMMDAEFQGMQETFADEHCAAFDDSDENKLVYTDIFKKYTQLVEGYVERRLKEAISDFSMQAFMEMLSAREEEMQSTDVFDMLVSFADFDTFKDIMLSHKHQRHGGSVQLAVNVSQVAIHRDEQEDGEEFPDLNLDITPVPSPKKIAGT